MGAVIAEGPAILTSVHVQTVSRARLPPLSTPGIEKPFIDYNDV